MEPSHSPVRREGIVREGKLDRKVVLDSLKQWLDTVLPATNLKLIYAIRVEPFPAASPAARNKNASSDGNSSPDGNISHDGNSSHDGASSAGAARASEKPDEFERPEIVVVFDGPDKDLL